jgi:o-succinylbenzoate synthase
VKLHSKIGRFGGALDHHVGNAKQRWSQREGLIFVAEMRSKGRGGEVVHRGYGEASPLPGYSPDTIEQCESCLQDVELFEAPHLSLNSIEALISAMPPLPAARFAVETALLDLLAQRLQQSVAGLFGHYATSARRCALLDPERPMRSAEATLKRGLTCAKLKVGGEWSEELVTIKRLRAEFPKLSLRLDANGSWTLPAAKKRLSLLEGLGIEFVEQPVAPGVMYRLVGSPVPIAADESLHTVEGRAALEPLMRDGGLRAIVLKPTVIGGFAACLKLQQWARTHKTVAIASHTFEGPIGTAAVAELALAMDSPMASGVDEHEVLTSIGDVVVPQLGERYLQLHHGGLGVAIDV